MKKLFLSAALVFAFIGLFGQQRQPSISFEKLKHDFGKIQEEKGKAGYRFGFVNTGSIPLIINEVTASCGCTTPQWSREPVLPGAKGFIEVAYDPKGRPGPFNKTITVKSNASQPVVTLTIVGDVVATPKAPEEEFKMSLGVLKVKNTHIGLGTVYLGQTKTETIEFINSSDKPVQLQFLNVPAHITVKSGPQSVAPGQKGKIEFYFEPSKSGDWGYITNWLQLKINDENVTERLIVSANIEEDFSALSPEQLAKAPVASFGETTLNFGTITEGEKIDHIFTVKNEGKSDLIIRKVKASCGCTAVNPDKNLLKPGESSQIKVIFDSHGKTGTQNKTITVITNDPKNAKVMLWLKGTVTGGQKP